MTRLETITYNKRMYADLEARIPSMTGLEKIVAKELVLKWIKGVKWMGGINDSTYSKAALKIMDEYLYTWDEIDAEFQRQIGDLV